MGFRGVGRDVLKLWVSIIVVVLAGHLAACGSGDEKASHGDRRGAWSGGGSEAALPVKTQPVERGEMSSYIETHARLEAERWIEVVSRVQGLARQLAAEEGDVVQAGQLLLQLEKDELQLAVEQATIDRDQTEANFKRAETLQGRELISAETLETARTAFENAEVALDQAKLQLEYSNIRSPIDGVVMERHVERGDLVHSNDVVYVVADLEPLQARIRVPEKRMMQLCAGQQARITVDPAPDRVFPATVRMINPGVDPSSGTVKVTLDVPSAGGLLKPGMFATVRIVTDLRENTLIIPKKSLVLETDDDDVFAVRDGRAQRVRIKLGYTDGDRVEVLSGLTPDDRVITVGHEGLKEGAAVRDVGIEAAADTTNLKSPSDRQPSDAETQEERRERPKRGTH
ncbi:MAG: efflux RND transporter periplasmic adaptor subunit [Candidatus Eisenbacteria bacterium]|uniref:Efflux RND transporter periplasmic adaptor subunit n=1 Tax=Eiseniibacteriota bacterium TaxID=2212470 RepID=A0A948WCD2_UNCEI|nr:efflux RND transporter periplasmic adaptor subunit [Candidatus Eisenbacteria bacterium]MBU1948056.1 efflux RND transporter periplasmic adaptor subunit [Candidatus Eisenbacteria bacterium]MBU2690818.1 efflux RND transporter periplasmic adaptor subunit [Candidatus Eisenbacteria bacterium]